MPAALTIGRQVYSRMESMSRLVSSQAKPFSYEPRHFMLMTLLVARQSHPRAVEGVTGRGFFLFWYTPVTRTSHCLQPDHGEDLSLLPAHTGLPWFRDASAGLRHECCYPLTRYPSVASQVSPSPDESLLTCYYDSTLLIRSGSENLHAANDGDDPARRFHRVTRTCTHRWFTGRLSRST